MRIDNPAIFECPKGKNGLHRWRLRGVGTSVNAECVCYDRANAQMLVDALNAYGMTSRDAVRRYG